ncbi:MAG: hypothetical protein EOM37_13305 [Proteobacteria bacterium]|nr:hypothetical protein [Pseudomonadota bacterium]
MSNAPTHRKNLNEAVRGVRLHPDCSLSLKWFREQCNREQVIMASSSYISFVALVGIIGEADADALCRAHGGRTIYISKPDRCSLRGIISDAGVESLCSEYRGEQITLPRGTAAPALVKERLVKLLELGKSITDAAREAGCTARYAQMVRRDAGLPPSVAAPRPPKPPKPRRETKRDLILQALMHNPEGLSPREIAEQLGVCSKYVQQVRREYL